MDIDLFVPIFWTFVFGSLLILGFRRLTKRKPTNKRWVRPEKESSKSVNEIDSNNK